MTDRQVTTTQKDEDGDILALCKPGEFWSPRQKRDAIDDIEGDQHSYFVNVPGVGRADIHVVNGPNGKFLRTDPDRTPQNNLDELPDC